MPLALGLLDPSLEILAVKTEVGTEYVTPEGLEELKKTQAAAAPEVFKPAGEPLQFSSKKARDLGFVTYLAANRRDLVQALDLPPLAIEDDPSLENPWKAVRIDLKGPVTSDKVRQVQKLIEDQISLHDVNFICLWIDSPGGSLVDSSRAGEFFAHARSQPGPHGGLHSQRGPRRRRLGRPGLRPGGDASAGGAGRAGRLGNFQRRRRPCCGRLIRKTLAPHKGRSWSLMAAMIDPNLDVYRCTRPGRGGIFLRRGTGRTAQSGPMGKRSEDHRCTTCR